MTSLYRLVMVLAVLAIGLGAGWLTAAGEPGLSAPVEPAVLDRLRQDGSASVLVVMDEQADLSAAYSVSDWSERGWLVYNALRDVAQQSQAAVVDLAQSQGWSYRSFFSSNVVLIRANSVRAVERLAAVPGVAAIRLARSHPLEPELAADTVVATGWNLSTLNPATGDYGMQAMQVWSQTGVRGAGIVVGGIDTGVRYTHEALVRQYRGYPVTTSADHNYNWYRPTSTGCGDGTTPCDDNGHGTETMGIVVGEDEAQTHRIGVAPAARWIACAGCGTMGCTDEGLIACADWMLAPCPIGQDPGDPGCNPDYRPHIINNSWGGDEGDMWFLDYVRAWRAAGIMPAFASGNTPDICTGLVSPGDYAESFASTAHFFNGNDPYGGGPSLADDATRMVKPNLSAPSYVTTSWKADDHSYVDGAVGTSMASPHTAGAVALCWSANPNLVGDLERTFDLLEWTARDTPTAGTCGMVSWVPAPGGDHVNTPNYDYGWGYLDALALVDACTHGTLAGFVADRGDSSLLTSAQVELNPGGYVAQTNSDGFFKIAVPPGTYSVQVSAPGYYTKTFSSLALPAAERVDWDIELTRGWYLGALPGPALTRFDGVFVPGPEDQAWANLVYFMGGRVSYEGDEDPSVIAFDPVTGVYTDTGHDMMEGVSNYTANLIDADPACSGGTPAIYVVGGYDAGSSAAVDLMQRFCVADGAGVVAVASDPWPGQAESVIYQPGGTAVVDGQIYVMGGIQVDLSGVLLADATFRFDPAAAAGERWTDLELPLSEPRGLLAAAVVDGRIYALGGISEVVMAPFDMVASRTAEVLDTRNLAAGWQPIADLPSPVAEGQGLGFDGLTLLDWAIMAPAGRLYVVGGGEWPGRSGQTQVFDVASGSWKSGFPPLNEARRGHAAAFVPLDSQARYDGRPGIWVWGGNVSGDDPPFGVAEQFSFHVYSERLYLPLVGRNW